MSEHFAAHLRMRTCAHVFVRVRTCKRCARVKGLCTHARTLRLAGTRPCRGFGRHHTISTSMVSKREMGRHWWSSTQSTVQIGTRCFMIALSCWSPSRAKFWAKQFLSPCPVKSCTIDRQPAVQQRISSIRGGVDRIFLESQQYTLDIHMDCLVLCNFI